MFLWNTPLGLKTFGLTPEFAEQSTALAANQGLYNGFLASGLIWGLIKKHDGFPIKIFFLSCVVVAGIFGALTVKPSIFFVQSVPAIAAILFLVLSRDRG